MEALVEKKDFIMLTSPNLSLYLWEFMATIIRYAKHSLTFEIPVLWLSQSLKNFLVFDVTAFNGC